MGKKTPIIYGKAVAVSLPSTIIQRLNDIAPKSGDRARLLQNWILEGLNRYELDCLFCRIQQERKREQ
jgi:hypothetical protein